VITTFGFNILLFALGWLIVTGLREHAAALRE